MKQHYKNYNNSRTIRPSDAPAAHTRTTGTWAPIVRVGHPKESTGRSIYVNVILLRKPAGAYVKTLNILYGSVHLLNSNQHSLYMVFCIVIFIVFPSYITTFSISL